MLLVLLGALAAQWVALSAVDAAWESEAAYVPHAVMNSVACTLCTGLYQHGFENHWG